MSELYEQMLENMNFIANSRFEQYRTLKKILANEDYEALELFLLKGFSINVASVDLLTNAFNIGETSVEFAKHLVSKGLNLNVLNLSGQNIFSRIDRNISEEMIIYLLQQGINPYEKDLYGYSAINNLRILNSDITDRLIPTYSMYMDEPDALETVWQTKDYELALATWESKFQRMGTIEQMSNYMDRHQMYLFIRNWINLLLLNKKYDMANFALEYYSDWSDWSALTFTPFAILSPTSAFITENRDLLERITHLNIEYLEEQRSLKAFLPDAYVYLNKSEEIPSEFTESIRQKVISVHASYSEEDIAHDITGVILSPNDAHAEVDLFEMENAISDEKAVDEVILEREYLFNMGMAYFQKGYFDYAKLTFHRLMQLDTMNNPAYLTFYAQAFAMIDYIVQRQQ